VEIQILISPSGDEVRVETVSILEDLWHDFQFFKSQAANLEQSTASPGALLLVKRYHRTALLMLVFYFEGVLNHWLKHLLGESAWLEMERKRPPLSQKVKCIEERLDPQLDISLDINEAKSVRNALAHLKPEGDLKLFEAITESLLVETEMAITSWLNEVESRIGIERHPNTREASRPFREWLGTSTPEAEEYSGA
jgi:hypothetical protein